MVPSGLLRRVALVKTDVSEEPGASFIRVTKIGELGTTKAATSNRRTLRRNTNKSYILRHIHVAVQKPRNEQKIQQPLIGNGSINIQQYMSHH
jgi:hypothetical protein